MSTEGFRNRPLGNLSLTRSPGERVAVLKDDRVIGYIELGEIQGYRNRAKLRFYFPDNFLILREELLEEDQR